MEMLQAIGFLLGLVCALAVILAIANAKLKVFEDPRIDKVTDMLPGNNCGACGLPGCRAFAEKLVAGELLPGACPPSDAETACEVADYLGVDAGDTTPKIARLLCAGGSDVAVQMADYAGQESCRSATATSGGSKGCRYGCLGFEDCLDACTFGAIQMSPTGLPVVDVEKCTSCGDCVRICPKALFVILPLAQHLLVQCKSELEGDDMLEQCRVGCTACGRCVADASPGLLKMKHNLPELNGELLELESANATLRCPTGAIAWVEGAQFQDAVWQSKLISTKGE